jgi:DNA-binding XRE family transcriptional regulator
VFGLAGRQVFSGSKLRARRKELRLSRDTLAFSLGVVTDTVGNWERGFCAPRKVEVISTLAEVLQCRVEDLFVELGDA